MAFTGFHPNALGFLEGLAEHNDRAWFGPARWKRVPAPYAADHPRAELLRHDGLVAATTDPLPPQAQTEDFPDWCVERWAPLRPLQTWVAAVAKEAAGY